VLAREEGDEQPRSVGTRASISGSMSNLYCLSMNPVARFTRDSVLPALSDTYR